MSSLLVKKDKRSKSQINKKSQMISRKLYNLTHCYNHTEY